MASTDALSYYSQPAGGLGLHAYHSTDHLPRKHVSSSSFLDNLIPPPRLAPYEPVRTSTYPSPTTDGYRPGSLSNFGPPGAIPVANIESNHGRIHKRGMAKARGKSRGEDSGEESHVTLTRTKTPDLAMPSPIDGSKSPSSRSITREKFKQNLWKLSQHQEEDTSRDKIDLSRTAEENEARSGLGIVAPRLSSRSVPDFAMTASNGYRRGHVRSQSHESQLSTASGHFLPSAPFVPPIRDITRPYTPPTNRSHAGSSASSNQPGLPFNTSTNQDRNRSRGTTVTSVNSLGDRPRLRVNTSGSATRFPNTSQSNITRPRRSTNQSGQSADIATPRSKSSGDRAFSFRTKQKDEPIDPLTRAATIQAARQAFEDREEAKARKQEEREQKAADKESRKQAKHEGRNRNASDTGPSTIGDLSHGFTGGARDFDTSSVYSRGKAFRGPSVGRPEKMEFLSGGEYAAVGGRGAGSGINSHPLKGQGIPGLREDHRVSRKRAAKGSYFRFVTWLRTKYLNAGRRRRG